MKNELVVVFIMLLIIPAGVMAAPGDYAGMMGYRQNETVLYGPGMMGYRQNETVLYGPGMMGNWQNTPGQYGTCDGIPSGMMNGWGYGNNGGMMTNLMGFMALFVILFILVWTIAGILLILWLYKQLSAR